ncbi:MAG: hypothetical protein Q8904_08830 [Bacteroidota bacterium]|nr:hypothetical protein [Bacteroidota bacterium]
MKHFLTSCLLVITVFAGVTTISSSKSEIVETKYRVITIQKRSLPDQHRGGFSISNLLMVNGQIRHTNSFQHLFPKASSSSKTSRIRHSNKTEHLKIITGYRQFLLKSAFSQRTGYYLYHLQKLLI